MGNIIGIKDILFEQPEKKGFENLEFLSTTLKCVLKVYGEMAVLVSLEQS
jgi:hypothetical protein